MIELIVATLTVASILHIWFETDAFVTYAKAFSFTGWYVEMYEESLEGNDWSYPEFLREFYGKTFFGKLFSCPTCLSLWISVAFGLTAAILTFNALWCITVLASGYAGNLLYNWGKRILSNG